jgi:cinnamyl-alcohol dehydrogenase
MLLLLLFTCAVDCIICRENADEDVTVKILYCGVCHSDLHTIKNEWGFTSFPVVPG